MNQQGRFGHGHGIGGLPIANQRMLGWFLFLVGGLLTIFVSPLRIFGVIVLFVGFLLVIMGWQYGCGTYRIC